MIDFKSKTYILGWDCVQRTEVSGGEMEVGWQLHSWRERPRPELQSVCKAAWRRGA